ncbi:MAG TPA: GNAT family N-acetyltransferase [Dehalococcoidia bacterium]|jgi:GNAT superfamily N-acetyltransferase|nr:GNAT family N-acetyltransferase [Dehalococcoidia bacterium]
MALTVVPFEPEHLDAAAELLAARHRRDRVREPRLPAAFEAAEAARPMVEHAFDTPGARGVVALRDGAPVGFLVAAPQLLPQTHAMSQFFPVRGAFSWYPHHAVAPGEDANAVYRAMYARLADSLVRSGLFAHYIETPARDADAQEALFSLGFGRDLCAAVREVDRPVPGGADVDIHVASTEDIEVVMALVHELTAHHALSPIFLPAVPEARPAQRQLQQDVLADPANAHFVAYLDGQAVGMQTFMARGLLNPMCAPEGSVYLFQGIVSKGARFGGVGKALLARTMAWAREQGYRYCSLHYATANLEGAAFWTSQGFEPFSYRLCRRIDERVVWATG